MTTFDAHLRKIEFRLSLLLSDDWLAAHAWRTSGYALRLSTPLWLSGGVRAYLHTPSEPPDPDDDPWNLYVSITPQVHLRGTLAVAEGLLGYALARPPPLRDLRAYVTADPFLAKLHERWESVGDLVVTPSRRLYELLDPFAASLESYLTIDSMYACVDGPRPPRKRR